MDRNCRRITALLLRRQTGKEVLQRGRTFKQFHTKLARGIRRYNMDSHEQRHIGHKRKGQRLRPILHRLPSCRRHTRRRILAPCHLSGKGLHALLRRRGRIHSVPPEQGIQREDLLSCTCIYLPHCKRHLHQDRQRIRG